MFYRSEMHPYNIIGAENIKNAFVKYVKIIPDDGLLVVNGDDSNCLSLRK